MAAPRLIIGLGNPGADYAETRHNAGFWLCERLAAQFDLPLRSESRFHGHVARTSDACWLLLPQTFMNRSGQAVSAMARFYRIAPEEMLVVHDELDLSPGVLRLKFGGGSGGHNGLKDIVAHLGTQDFWRLRIGIGHPGERDQVVDYVLKKPRGEERLLIEEALERSLRAWPFIAAGDYPAAMRSLNARPVSPASEGKP